MICPCISLMSFPCARQRPARVSEACTPVREDNVSAWSSPSRRGVPSRSRPQGWQPQQRAQQKGGRLPSQLPPAAVAMLVPVRPQEGHEGRPSLSPLAVFAVSREAFRVQCSQGDTL